MAQLKAPGFRVVSFLGDLHAGQPRVADALPDDLLAVFNGAKALAQSSDAKNVDAWEMVGEPDVGYCRDLPDRLVAFQKAVYLGMKAGAAEGGGRTTDGGRPMTEDGRLTTEGGVRTTEGGRRTTGDGRPMTEGGGRTTEDGGMPAFGGTVDRWIGGSVDGARTAEGGRWTTGDGRAMTEGGGRTTEDGRPMTGDGGRTAEGGVRTTEGVRWTTDGGARTADDGWRTTEGVRPLVLMGALALPPGPWFERAAKNGLLDYTDAYNFHFYGNAQDLSGVIAAHAVVAKRIPSSVVRPPSSALRPPSSALPLWITECGMNAVSSSDFLNPVRRRAQADFTLSTAKQALAAKEVAVFMPFILVHDDDPHAMTLAAEKPLAAWERYAKFTRDTPWPQRPLSALPREPNPIVVQWMPDFGAAVAHKVSGTYRFWQRQPMHGEIRIYNFSTHAVRGSLRSNVPAVFRGSLVSPVGETVDVSIPAGERFVTAVTFVAPAAGYARGDCEWVFVESTGRESLASFGLETWPESQDFTESAVSLSPLPNRKIRFPEFADYEPGKISEPWQTINSLQVAAAEKGRGSVFWTDRASLDPLKPAMAFAAISGVPADGFLRVQLDQPMTAGRTVRVDLVDADGQRFCIWENLGQSYFVKSNEVWLNVHDMQIYFWGHCSESSAFHPERVREIQLWFYRKTPGERTRVQLSWMTARGAARRRGE